LIAQGCCRKQAGKKGRLPLHSALQLSHNTDDIISAALAGCPTAASLPYRSSIKKVNGKSCLHLALLRQVLVEKDIVLAILAACPRLACLSFDEHTPLHMALTWPKASSAVIQALLAAYPEAVRLRDKEMCTPLHCAAGANIYLETLQSLLSAHPEAGLMVNINGHTPLHMAVLKKRTEGARALLEAYPDAATLQDTCGCTPLHLVARSTNAAAVMPELFAARPTAAQLRDRSGWTPLWLALVVVAHLISETLGFSLLILSWPRRT
jgi:hypothetical protein